MTANTQSGSMIEIRNNLLEIKDSEVSGLKVGVSGFVLTPTPALTIEPVVSPPLHKTHIFKIIQMVYHNININLLYYKILYVMY